jgi:hypothetical protein
MKLSKLNELPASRDMIDVFGGYNHNLRIGQGEFYDMTNLSSADYPVLSPRPKRGVYATPNNPTALISKDALCYVDGATFYINRDPLPGLTLDINKVPKSLISMGAYVIIMPDKKYVNTKDRTYGSIEAKSEIKSGTVTFTLCKLDGTEFKNTDAEGNETDVPYGSTAPTNPKNLDLWIDTSSTPHVLKMYASTTDQWTSVATTYIKITAPGIGEGFEANDGVRLSGITIDALKDMKSAVIWARGDDYIVVTGILDQVSTQDVTEANPIIVERRMPEMDYRLIVECNNRLWGCNYGLDLDGNVVNEIYACKLGDFKNWNCYAGISTDSYAVSVGTDGQFTGAITHLGYPLFFKENCVHKIYGNYPANYQVQTTTCRGVQKDCHKSLAIVNEILYYKSRSAVCAFDGSLPVEISSALGEVAYENAVAGTLGNKYYISMKEIGGDYNLFVYDTAKGMWHREDNAQIAEFCNSRGNLYYIDYADKMIKAVHSLNMQYKVSEENKFKWSAVTGVIGTDSPDKKSISRLVVRLKLEVGTTVAFSIEYDSSGAFEHLFTMTGTNLTTFSVPIRPKRCDHLRLRIDGEGTAKIFSICKTTEQGSDV